MKKETYQRNKENKLYAKALPFIDKLVSKGVPLSAIDTNDFNSSIPAVYITREYGRIGGGKFKKYYAWNERTLKYGVRFYKATKPTSFDGHCA